MYLLHNLPTFFQRQLTRADAISLARTLDSIILATRRSVHNVNSWIGKTHKTYKNQVHHDLAQVTVSDPELWTAEQSKETPMEYQENVVHIGVLRKTGMETTGDLFSRTLRKGGMTTNPIRTASATNRVATPSQFVFSLFLQAPSVADKTRFLEQARAAILAYIGVLPEVISTSPSFSVVARLPFAVSLF